MGIEWRRLSGGGLRSGSRPQIGSRSERWRERREGSMADERQELMVAGRGMWGVLAAQRRPSASRVHGVQNSDTLENRSACRS